MKKYATSKIPLFPKSATENNIESAISPNSKVLSSVEKSDFGDTEKRYCINPNFLLREIGDEYVIVPVSDSCLINHALMSPNGSAVLIWETFMTPSTIEDVVTKCLQQYDASPEEIRCGVHQFVKEALSYEILEEVKR